MEIKKKGNKIKVKYNEIRIKRNSSDISVIFLQDQEEIKTIDVSIPEGGELRIFSGIEGTLEVTISCI